MRKTPTKGLIDLGAVTRKTKGLDHEGNPDIATGLFVRSNGLDRE